MSSVRLPAVAGQFYPAAPEQLRAILQQCFYGVPATDSEARCPRALIVPHAGYVYSGSLAAAAFALWRTHRGHIWRVVLLGPSHRVPFRGIALTSAHTYRTPLGDIPLDTQSVGPLQALPGVQVLDMAHVPEHSLEVQLPFLQTVLDEFTLLPMVVGDATPEQAAAVLEPFLSDEGTVFVISSDLSHYLGDPQARGLDRQTAEAIESLNPDGIGRDQACGRIPVNGLLTLARGLGWEPVRLGLCNSGDTTGDRSHVVGYGAWAFYEPVAPDGHLSSGEREQLRQVALASIRHGLSRGVPLAVHPADYPPALRKPGAVFVTLHRHGELRGCIGSLEAERPLVDDVARHAWDAAFADPRFPPLTAAELDGLTLSISQLSPPEALTVRDEADLLQRLRPGRDGLILSDGRRRATFLPSVWNQLPRAREFLRQLKRKGGWPADHWSPDMNVWRYTVDEF